MLDHRTLLKTIFVRSMWIIVGIPALLLLMAGCGARTTEPERPSISTRPQLQRMRYTIQVGAFDDRSTARELKQELDSSFPKVRIESTDGLHRVLIGRFKKEAKADETAARLRRQGHQAFVRAEIDA